MGLLFNTDLAESGVEGSLLSLGAEGIEILVGDHIYSFTHVFHNVLAKCTPILRIPAGGVGVPKGVQIMHTYSTGKSGRARETVFLCVFL